MPETAKLLPPLSSLLLPPSSSLLPRKHCAPCGLSSPALPPARLLHRLLSWILGFGFCVWDFWILGFGELFRGLFRLSHGEARTPGAQTNPCVYCFDSCAAPVARIPQVQSPGRWPQPLSSRRYPVQGSDTRAMPPEADRGRHVDVAQAMPPAGGRHLHCQSPEADVDVAEKTMWVPMQQYVVMCRQRPT